MASSRVSGRLKTLDADSRSMGMLASLQPETVDAWHVLSATTLVWFFHMIGSL